jgi:hypothetical protein
MTVSASSGDVEGNPIPPEDIAYPPPPFKGPKIGGAWDFLEEDGWRRYWGKVSTSARDDPGRVVYSNFCKHCYDTGNSGRCLVQEGDPSSFRTCAVGYAGPCYYLISERQDSAQRLLAYRSSAREFGG